MPARDEQVPELSYLPTYTQTRAPPDSGPPPAYANVIGKVYPYSLRPVLVVTTFCTFLYLVLVAISNFKDIGSSSNNTAMNIFDILTGALLLVVALVEVVGFVAALKTNMKLAVLYSKLSVPGFALVIVCEVLNIASHFMFKSRIINNCIATNTGAVAPSSSGFGWFGQSSGNTVMDSQAATSYCNSQWKYDSTWDIIWLVVTAVLGVPFVMFSFAFVRQLRNPNSVRQRETNFGWWQRRNNQQPPSAQYANGYSSRPYDPQSQPQAYSYPPAPYGSGPYAAPAGPPPGAFSSDGHRDLPDYERGDMQGDFDDDRKSPVTSPTSYGYSGAGRPSTSRDRDLRENDAAKDSQVTIRLDDDVDTKSRGHGRDSHDDDTPRI